ncbi:hypothetical protein B296_00017001 [Ensete ventricosum]|uniref:Uncharacterized protein n=1 Tax=Ensete ventricosum TaxID=4639 RepID=A0A426YBZ3_ENSVE|nr:hypothetical protein B296_00017001 [Ensete ventricosum]
MRRYDQELLGASLWCTTQQEEGLWIQGVNAMVPQRWVFMCMIGAARELDYFSAHIRLREPDKSKDKADERQPLDCCLYERQPFGLALAASSYPLAGDLVTAGCPYNWPSHGWPPMQGVWPWIATHVGGLAGYPLFSEFAPKP